MSDIEGEVTRVGVSGRGQRTSFKLRELRGPTRGSRVGDGVLAIANFLPRSFTAEMTNAFRFESLAVAQFTRCGGGPLQRRPAETSLC